MVAKAACIAEGSRVTRESTYTLWLRGCVLLSQRHFHQAAVVLERARELEPQKASIRESLARAYYASGRPDDARAEFEAALEIEPTNDYAHFGLALCLERIGQLATARGHAKLAVVMRPQDENYRRALERIDRAS
jgi:Tfp pilus assembly protein PilF